MWCDVCLQRSKEDNFAVGKQTDCTISLQNLINYFQYFTKLFLTWILRFFHNEPEIAFFHSIWFVDWFTITSEVLRPAEMFSAINVTNFRGLAQETFLWCHKSTKTYPKIKVKNVLMWTEKLQQNISAEKPTNCNLQLTRWKTNF